MKKKLLLAGMAIVVAILTITGQVFNVAYWVQTEFNMVSYSPWSIWLWFIGSVMWLAYVRVSKAHWGFYIVGIMGLFYSLLRVLGMLNVI